MAKTKRLGLLHRRLLLLVHLILYLDLLLPKSKLLRCMDRIPTYFLLLL